MARVTPKQAAQAVFVSKAMIHYWVKLGRISKYPIEGFSRRYLVEMEEVVRALDWREARPSNLLTPKEAGRLINISTKQISYYACRGYISKHMLPNGKHYLVDRDEVLDQPRRIAEAFADSERKERLRKKAMNQPRNGKLFTKL